MTTLTVYVCLAIFNFVGSIIQGVAGIGDAIFLQVLWYMAFTADPEQFGSTPLGAEPVSAVALLMFVRLLFMAPLVVYLGLSDSIFSRSMTIIMAIPSTLATILGMYLFTLLDGKGGILKLVLGISSFAFALMYLGILTVRTLSNRKKLAAMREKHVKVVVEADAIQEEAHMDLHASFTNLQSSFVNRVPNSSILIMQPPANYHGISGGAAPAVGGGQEPIGFDTVPVEAHEPERDPDTGLPVGTTEAFVSTITGAPFTAAEAAVPQPTEDNVPQLTPSKLSPSRTLTFTRVRINRNLDANGKIKMSTKIGAAVAASTAGLLASLTGVNAPPQIIFILLFDAPNYIVRVNFSAQSIPSNVLRFIIAVANGKLNSAQVPIFIVTVIFGFAGVFAGNAIGRLLGPTSFNIFVLCLLLLSSLVMVIHSVFLLAFFTLATVAITAVVAVWERRKNAEVIEKQTEAEMEIEKRMYDVMEELQRNNNSFIPPSSVNEQMFQLRQEAQRPRAMWGNLDNDDEGHNAATPERPEGPGDAKTPGNDSLAEQPPPAVTHAAHNNAKDEDGEQDSQAKAYQRSQNGSVERADDSMHTSSTPSNPALNMRRAERTAARNGDEADGDVQTEPHMFRGADAHHGAPSAQSHRADDNDDLR